MTADVRDIPVLWLSLEPSGSAARASLEGWARARGLRLVLPGDDPSPTLAYPADVVATIEQELIQAREAVTAQDTAAAERALAHAEGELARHPELPQASWLLAEVDRALAARFTRLAPRDPERAAAAFREARGLDGGRSPGLGEDDLGASPVVEVDVVWEDPSRAAELLVDGVATRPGKLRVAEGRHHLLLLVSGRPVWAGWHALGEGTRLVVPYRRAPCSQQDFELVVAVDRELRAGKVMCGDWVAARADGRGALSVARCQGERCAPLVEWRTSPTSWPAPPGAVDRSRWPAWAPWTLVGAALVTAVATGLVASGALETAPTSTRFSYGGVTVR